MTPSKTFANDLRRHTKIRCATPTSKIRDMTVEEFIPIGTVGWIYPILALLPLCSRMAPPKRNGGEKISWKSGLRGRGFGICHLNATRDCEARDKDKLVLKGFISTVKPMMLERRPLVCARLVGKIQAARLCPSDWLTETVAGNVPHRYL